MPYPTHAPIADAAVDRFAAILLKLESSPAPGLHLTPVGLRIGAIPTARIIARFDDGGREPLTVGDARFLAICLRSEGAYLEAGLHADALDRAVADALAMADEVSMRDGCGDVRVPAIGFGGR